MTGIVKWFHPTLGYGFIAISAEAKTQHGIPPEVDLYVHAREVQGKFPKKLLKGQEVEFEIGRGARGPEAIEVKPLKRTAAAQLAPGSALPAF